MLAKSTLVAIIFIIDAVKSAFNLRKAAISPASSTLSVANRTLYDELDDEFNLSSTIALNTFDTDENSVENLYKKTNQQAVFYFSLILFGLTFLICMTLKAFRNQPFLPSKVNRNKNK